MSYREIPEKQEELIEKVYKRMDELERRCEALEQALADKESK